MSEPTGMARRIWLHLLKEGGRWEASELGKAMDTDPSAIRDSVKALVDVGAVARFAKEKRMTYGVTTACKIPRSVTVADVLACDLLALEGEV